MDWFSHFVLSWEISNSLTVDFCLRAMYQACGLHSVPRIFNSD